MLLYYILVTFVAQRHVPRLAIKSSLVRTRTKHSCGRARFKEPFTGQAPRSRRRSSTRRREKGGGSIREDSIGLLHPAGSRRGPAGQGRRAVSNLATFGAAGSRVLAGDRVKGIYIHFDPNNPIPRIPIWNTISVLSVYTYLALSFFFSLLLLVVVAAAFLSSLQLPPPFPPSSPPSRRCRPPPARSKIRPARRALKLRASSVLHLSPLRK